MVDVIDKPVVQSDRAQVQHALREIGAQALFDASTPNVELQQGRVAFVSPPPSRETIARALIDAAQSRARPIVVTPARPTSADVPLPVAPAPPPVENAPTPDTEAAQRQQEAAALLTKARLLHHQALLRLAECIGTSQQEADRKLRAIADKTNVLQKSLDRTLDAQTLQGLRDQFRDLEHELQVVALDVTVSAVKDELAANKPYTHLVIPALLVAYGIVALWSLTGPANAQLPVLQLPYAVLAVGLIGGTMACFYRYIRVGPLNLLPGHTVWFATKPWLGMLTAAFAYLALQVGLFVFGSDMSAPAATDPSRMTVFLVIAWLVAFSDWFFEKVVTALAGKVIGGDGAGVLSTLDTGRGLTSAEAFLTDFARNPDILTMPPAQPVAPQPEPGTPAPPSADADLLELDDMAEDEASPDLPEADAEADLPEEPADQEPNRP
ncbi:MAG: hypothetical protein IPM16_19265 [Chloroflexi bacterium]|nr:hypothetical protein [Chloroflexota bacterium]